MPLLTRVIPASLIALGLPLASLSLAGLAGCAPMVEDSTEQSMPLPDMEQPVNATREQPSDSNFLWSVETPTNTVFLLGSIHILSEDDYPLALPIQTAFDEAEKVVFEVDLGALDQQETLALVTEKAAPDTEAERLQTALTPEMYALAEAAAADVNLPLTFFDNTEPWFFSVNLVVLKLMQLGFSGDYGIDQYLFEQATTAEKEIIGLETMAEQLDIFDNLSIETQQSFVEQTITELDTLESSFNELRLAWHNGDVNTMEELATIDPELYPELHTKLLTERNLNWMEEIKPMLSDTEDYLIVVGAAHMVGESGLVQQLESIGYAVEQQ